MSPLQIEYLKLINFLQHETHVCTHLRLAEILCRQDYIPNIWGNYYIDISESSIVETQFCFTLQVLKLIFHGPWYHLDYERKISFGLQWDRGTTAATNLVLLWWKFFIRNWVSKKSKYSDDMTSSRILFLPDSHLIFWWYRWQTQLCHILWPEVAWMTGSNISATQQLQGVALSSIFPPSQKMP